MSARLRLLLICSLALNLFLAGAGIGALVMARHGGVDLRPKGGPQSGGPGGSQGGRTSLWRSAERLPQPSRDRLHARLKATGEAAKPEIERARALRREAAALFAAPTLDRAAAEARLAEARQVETGVRARFEAAVIEVAADLPPDQRRILAEGLQRGFRGPERRGEPREPPPPRDR